MSLVVTPSTPVSGVFIWSYDRVNWVGLSDRSGVVIAITAAGGSEFSTSYLYLRPLATGGTGDDLDVFISLRG